MERRWLILLLVVLLGTSCSTTYNVYTSYNRADGLVGLVEPQIFELMGAPDNVVNYDGGYIMVYRGNDYIFQYDRGAGQIPVIQLYMNNNDVCVRTMVSNNKPVIHYDPVRTLGLLWLLSYFVWWW